MRINRFSHASIKKYSELVRSAVRLGVSLDEIITETRKYHGMDFANRIENNIRFPMDR